MTERAASSKTQTREFATKSEAFEWAYERAKTTGRTFDYWPTPTGWAAAPKGAL